MIIIRDDISISELEQYGTNLQELINDGIKARNEKRNQSS